MVICPVCLQEASADDGVVAQHLDGVGKICAMSGRPPFTWDERSVRAAVPGRSGCWCEFCHATRATNMHHRKNRSQGGLWTPANILHLCGSGTTGCHGYFTGNRKTAYDVGVSVRRHEEPAYVPVHTPRGLLWLSDDIAPPVPPWAR